MTTLYPVYELVLTPRIMLRAGEPGRTTMLRVYDMRSLYAVLISVEAGAWGRLSPSSFAMHFKGATQLLRDEKGRPYVSRIPEIYSDDELLKIDGTWDPDEWQIMKRQSLLSVVDDKYKAMLPERGGYYGNPRDLGLIWKVLGVRVGGYGVNLDVFYPLWTGYLPIERIGGVANDDEVSN